jgi:hypothetical protein
VPFFQGFVKTFKDYFPPNLWDFGGVFTKPSLGRPGARQSLDQVVSQGVDGFLGIDNHLHFYVPIFLS